MKTKIFSFVCLLGFLASTSAYAADPKQCECGEHSTGITAFTVDGEDCCTSTPGDYGFQYTYTPNGNIWEVATTTRITGVAAQEDCCPGS